MRRTTLSVLSALAILLSGMIVPEAAAQSRRDKEQTYVLEKPYEVWGIERSVFSVIGENSRNALKIKWFSCA